MLRRKPIDPGRAPIYPHEIVKSKIDVLEKRILTDFHDIPEWQIRTAYYKNPKEYEWIDRTWKKIKVGDTWGGPDVTAFFKTKVKLPKRYNGKLDTFRSLTSFSAFLSG